MNLYELRRFIMARGADDFHTVSSGPLYNSRSLVISRAGGLGPRVEGVETHDTRLVAIDDVDIAIEWGMPLHDREDEHHPWAIDASFPDPSVRTYIVDVFCRGALVDREYVCSVDGGRAYLPAPSAKRTEEGPYRPGEKVLWQVSEWELAIARIVDGDRSDFDRYFRQSGITVDPA